MLYSGVLGLVSSDHEVGRGSFSCAPHPETLCGRCSVAVARLLQVQKISPDTPGAYWVPEDKRVRHATGEYAGTFPDSSHGKVQPEMALDFTLSASPWSFFTSLATHADGCELSMELQASRDRRP